MDVPSVELVSVTSESASLPSPASDPDARIPYGRNLSLPNFPPLSKSVSFFFDDGQGAPPLASNLPFGRRGSSATALPQWNAPFGSHRSEQISKRNEPFGVRDHDDSEKADELSDSLASSSESSRWSSSSGSDGSTEGDEEESETEAGEGGEDPTFPNFQRRLVFALLVVTQLVANFDSGALASIYGMKPAGPHILCTAQDSYAQDNPPSTWKCPPLNPDGTSFPPSLTAPGVATFLATGAEGGEAVWECSSSPAAVRCRNDTVPDWECHRETSQYVPVLDSGRYLCVFAPGDDLRKSLLHDPAFDDLYQNKMLQGLLSSIVYLGISLGALVTGFAFNYVPSHQLLAVSLVGNVGFCIFFALSHNRAALFSSRFLVGVTQSTLLVYAPVWVDEHAIKDQTATWMALIQAAVPLGIVTGYLTAGSLAARTDLTWGWSFYFQCLALAPLTLAICLLPRRMISISVQPNDVKEEGQSARRSGSGQEATSEGPGVWRVLTDGVVWFAVLTVTSLYFVVTAMQLWVTDYLTMEPPHVSVPGDTPDARYQTIVTSFGIAAVTGPVCGVVLGGFVLDHPRLVGGYQANPLRAAFFSMVAGGCAAVAAISSLVFTSFMGFIAMLWLALFFGGCVVPAITGVIIAAVPYELRGATSSFSGVVFNLLGYFSGPLLVGVVADLEGLRSGFRFAMGVSLVAFAFSVLSWAALLRRTYMTEGEGVGICTWLCGGTQRDKEQDQEEEEEGGSSPLDPFLGSLLLLARYHAAEVHRLDAPSVAPSSNKSLHLPKRCVVLPESPDALLKALFEAVDPSSDGGASPWEVEYHLRRDHQLLKSFLALDTLGQGPAVNLPEQLRVGLVGLVGDDPIPLATLLPKALAVLEHIAEYKKRRLPRRYAVVGFEQGSSKCIWLERIPGATAWRGPENEDSRIYLYSTLSPLGAAEWTLGTEADYNDARRGFLYSRRHNRFRLLVPPHRQHTWKVDLSLCREKKWYSTIGIRTVEQHQRAEAMRRSEVRRQSTATLAGTALGMARIVSTTLHPHPNSPRWGTEAQLSGGNISVPLPLLLRQLRAVYASASSIRQTPLHTADRQPPLAPAEGGASRSLSQRT